MPCCFRHLALVSENLDLSLNDLKLHAISQPQLPLGSNRIIHMNTFENIKDHTAQNIGTNSPVYSAVIIFCHLYPSPWTLHCIHLKLPGSGCGWGKLSQTIHIYVSISQPAFSARNFRNTGPITTHPRKPPETSCQVTKLIRLFP